jgi:hypothetical protein
MCGNPWRLTGLSLTILLLLKSAAFAENMTFELKSNGANTAGSTWIVADGEITNDSATDLQNYLNTNWGFATHKVPYDVFLNSPGGNLVGGIKLGEFIRKNHFTTTVSKIVPIPIDPRHAMPAPGACESACAIAFIGGTERYTEAGRLGVHQFYNQLSLNDPSQRLFNALDMSAQQTVSAILIDYAFRMGVDPRFIALASATPPNQMHYLNKEELETLKVVWNPKQFDPWAIEPSGNGVIAFTKSKDKTETAVLFCRKDGIPRLFIKPDSAEVNWYKQAIAAITSGSAFHINITPKQIALRDIGGAPAIEITLPGFEPQQIVGMKSLDVGVDGPRSILEGFSFELPIENALSTMRIALKNCT